MCKRPPARENSKGSAAGHKRDLLGGGRDQGSKEETSQEGGRR